MKNLTKYIVILMLLLTSTSFWSQIDPEEATINSKMKPTPVNISITTTKTVETNQDLTNGLRDDPTLYYSTRAGSVDSIRLIYFLHGIGGDNSSWGTVINEHIGTYRYDPYRPGYTGNQNNFRDASKRTRDNMQRDYLLYKSFLTDSFYLVDKPYVIAHSLGGLVARDMDMKYNTPPPLGALFDSVNRRFYGLVTFGTPHAGALIVGNQDKLEILGGTLTTKILKATFDTTLVNLSLNSWAMNLIASTMGVGNKLSELAAYLGDSVASKIIHMFSDKSGITKQFTPTSTYLTDTLNTFSNPKLAKALFYGEEEDPILWRIALYMVKPAPEYLPAFSANDDSQYMNDITEMVSKLDLKSIGCRGHANYHLSCARNWWFFWRGIGTGSHMNKYGLYNLAANSTKEAADYTRTMNSQYKEIIGVINENNSYILDTINWTCQANITIKTYIKHTNILIQTISFKRNIITPTSCASTVYFTTNTSWIRRKHYIEYISSPIVVKRLIDLPNDATVTRASAKAFPGCIDKYKNFMGPVQLSDGTWSRGKVNHLQMRNCSETKWALEQIYKGDGNTVPKFFKLHER